MSDILYDHMTKTMNFLQTLPMPKPSPLNISTRSAKCVFSRPLDLQKVTEWVQNMKESQLNIPGLVQYMFGNFVYRPELIQKKERINSKEHRLFYNQATVIMDLEDGKNPVNIKFFINGSISIVGSKSEEGGKIGVLKFLHSLQQSIPEYHDITVEKYMITCINSDYDVYFRIDRAKLHQILSTTKYYCDFDPCRYPGVEIIYKYHLDEPIEKQDGICYCLDDKPNEKKQMKMIEMKKKKRISTKVEEVEPEEEFSYLGQYPTLEKVEKKPDTDVIQKWVEKKKECKCKNVTIFVFQSGSMIITGSNTMDQLQLAYDFANLLLKTYFQQIRKITMQDCFDFLHYHAEHWTDSTSKGKEKVEDFVGDI